MARLPDRNSPSKRTDHRILRLSSSPAGAARRETGTKPAFSPSWRPVSPPGGRQEHDRCDSGTLAVTLSVEPAPASQCNASFMMRERTELILPALDKAKQAAAVSVESGAGATERRSTFLPPPIGRNSWPRSKARNGGHGGRGGSTVRQEPVGHRRRIGALAVIAVCLLMTGHAGAGETDDHALMICDLAAKSLVQHVHAARQNGVNREGAEATVEFMVPAEASGETLDRARRMTAAIIDALYAMPVAALERKSTKEHAVSMCLSHWPILAGDANN